MIGFSSTSWIHRIVPNIWYCSIQENCKKNKASHQAHRRLYFRSRLPNPPTVRDFAANAWGKRKGINTTAGIKNHLDEIQLNARDRSIREESAGGFDRFKYVKDPGSFHTIAGGAMP